MSTGMSVALSYLTVSALAVDVVWNAPFPMDCSGCESQQSAAYFAKFGIRANDAASFNGKVVSTVYTPKPIYGSNGTFGMWPYYTDPTTPVNGGIPQRGDLSAHLASVQLAVEHLFPDPGHDGIVVIDQELWVPWLIPAARSVYVNESIKFAGGNVSLAVQQFNESSLEWMVETVKLCRELRPQALWGYYGRPDCYTGWSNTSAPAGCTESVKERNDKLMPLWAAQNALFPSVYIGTNPVYGNKTRSHRYIDDEITESVRLQTKLVEAGHPKPKIYSYTWYALFTSPCNLHANCTLMRDPEDLDIEFKEPVRAGVDGMIVWGSSGDIGSAARCDAMSKYMEMTLGPYLHGHSTATDE